MSDWWSMENSRSHFSTFLLLLLAECSQKSPKSSTVSNLNSENPPDSKFEKLLTMTHQLSQHGLRMVLPGAERQPLHKGQSYQEGCFLDYAKIIHGRSQVKVLGFNACLRTLVPVCTAAIRFASPCFITNHISKQLFTAFWDHKSTFWSHWTIPGVLMWNDFWVPQWHA